MAFKKATKERQKLRLAFIGPSGSGKTWSALTLAESLVEGTDGRIAMIDTERGSGALYGDDFDYDHDELAPPYSPDRYIAKINEAEKAGYAVLIIDSGSHAWTGTGGVVEMANKWGQGAKTPYGGWDKATPEQNKFIDRILGYNGHVILCLRTKTAYEIQENDKGKKAPVKIGLAPVQREGLEYEFSLVFDLEQQEHLATVSKDRTKLFQGKPPFLITKEIGKQILGWLASGVDPEESREIFRQEILPKVTFIESVELLNKFFIENKPEAEKLGLVTELVSACGDRKKEIKKAAA